MRHRSRSRNYDSNDNYKSRRSPAKYESSRSHKTKTIHSHYSSEGRKHESSKIKKSSDRSRYDNHRDHDSDSDDKYDKKGDSNYDRDCKKTKFSKYSPGPKHSRKYDDYTHSYRRRSMSSEISNHSYDSKYKKYDDKSDSKKIYYKQNKDSKPSKPSRSPSSDPMSDSKVKLDLNKEKIKDKKLKKKSKKSDKDKEKKKRKRQKHSSEEDNCESDAKRNPEDKLGASKSSKHANDDDNGDDETDSKSKSKPKLEPFKVKETSNLKSQINFLNSSSIFTKDEWQKEASDDDGHKKSDSKVEPKTESSSVIVKKIKSEPYEPEAIKKPIKTEMVEETPKEPPPKKQKSEEVRDKEVDEKAAERARKKRHRNSHSKARDNPVRGSKHREPDENDGKSFSSRSAAHEACTRPTRSRSHNRPAGDNSTSSRKDKQQRRSSRDTHRKPTSGAAANSVTKGNDDSTGGKKSMPKQQTAIEDSFEDERIELPSTPTDAQYTGLFARLPEDPVSDTEVDEIVPPMLLDDRMKALLVNDPNMCQEAWDVEDDLLLSKRDSLIVAPRHRGLLETLAVPWALLIDEATLNKPSSGAGALVASAATAVVKAESSTDDGATTAAAEATVANRGLARFTVVARLVENLGLSRQLCSDALWAHVERTCPGSTFLHPIAPVHQTLMSHRTRRNTIFSERGLFAGALSARKDLFIRRVLYEPIT